MVARRETTVAGSPKRSAPSRFDALDGWRGLCAIMVVMLHAPIAGPIGQSAFVRNSYLFVDFFFVLSGFVIAHAWGRRLVTEHRWTSFIQARFWRVYPLHFVMLIAFAAFEVAMRLLRGDTVPDPVNSPSAFIHNLFLTHSLGVTSSLGWNYPSWSISAEFFAYLTFAMLAVCVGKRLGLALAVVAAGGLALLFVRVGHLETHFEFGWLRCLVGFSFGAILRIWFWEPLRLPVGIGASRGWTLLELAAVAYVGSFVSLAGHSTLSLAAPFVFAAAIFIFAHEGGGISRFLKTRPIAWFGLLSYSVYMTHAFVLARMTNAGTILEKLSGWQIFDGAVPEAKVMATDLGGEVLVLAILLALTIGLSALTWRFVEVPGQALGKWIAARAPKPSYLKHDIYLSTQRHV